MKLIKLLFLSCSVFLFCTLTTSTIFAGDGDFQANEKDVERKLDGFDGPVSSESDLDSSYAVIGKIQEALEDAIQNGLDLSDGMVVKKLLLRLNLPSPTGKFAGKTIQELTLDAKKVMTEKYCKEAVEEIKNRIREEAAEKYPLIPVRSRVEFDYTVGGMNRHVKGLFVSINNRSMRVDDTHITLLDLPDHLRSQYDPRFNRELREGYVNAKLGEKRMELRKEQQQVFVKLLKAQDEKNEDNGYIYVKPQRTWTTPQKYFDFIFPTYKEKSRLAIAQAKELAEQQRLEAAKQSEEMGNGEGMAQGNRQVPDKVYNEVVARQKDLQKQILSGGGVDSAQGFQLALWGTSRRDVGVLFSRHSNFVTENDRDIVCMDNGLPFQVDFYYEKDLDCVIEYYAVSKPSVATGGAKHPPTVPAHATHAGTGATTKGGKSADEEKKAGKATAERKVFSDKDFVTMMRGFRNSFSQNYEERLLNIDNISNHILTDETLPLPGEFIPKDRSKIPSSICYEWYIDSNGTPRKCKSGDKPDERLYVIHWVGRKNMITVLFVFNDSLDNAFTDFYVIRERLK